LALPLPMGPISRTLLFSIRTLRQVSVGDDWVGIVTIPNTHDVPEGVADAQGERQFGGDVLNTCKRPVADEEDLVMSRGMWCCIGHL
jgi:hypothetical protein